MLKTLTPKGLNVTGVTKYVLGNVTGVTKYVLGNVT
jgi:hypothetical protein